MFGVVVLLYFLGMVNSIVYVASQSSGSVVKVYFCFSVVENYSFLFYIAYCLFCKLLFDLGMLRSEDSKYGESSITENMSFLQKLKMLYGKEEVAKRNQRGLTR